MTDRDDLLARLLAETDAAVSIPRKSEWGTSHPANAYFARLDAVGSGFAWQQSERSTAQRMSLFRLIASAADEGMILVRKHRSFKWPKLRLTDLGEAHARAMTGMPDLAECLDLLARLQTLGGVKRLWVSELELTTDWTPHGRYLVEMTAYPGLGRRGWLEANSSRDGHARYRLSPAGASALATPPAGPSGLPDIDGEAVEAYAVAFAGAMERMRSSTPDGAGEIGAIPLPASTNGVEGFRKSPHKPRGKGKG